MTRNEEIRQEALKWKTDDNEFIAQTAFEAGALWADEHQKSPWKDIENDALPEYNTPVLLHIKDDDRIVVGIMVEVDERLCWCVFGCKGLIGLDDADRWAPIPELPKGGGR